MFKQQLSGEKWDVELGCLTVFGWAMSYSCPVMDLNLFYIACLSPVGNCRSFTPDSAELGPCSCWQTHRCLQHQVKKVCRQQEEEEEGDIQEADSYQVRTHQTLQTQPGRDTFCGREGMVCVCMCMCACVCVHVCASLSLSLFLSLWASFTSYTIYPSYSGP